MMIKVDLVLPLVNSLSGAWDVNPSERAASWETYVDIVTRLPFSCRDARQELRTVEELLEKMRETLKKYGPSVAAPSTPNALSFAHLALTVMNVVLRPAIAGKRECGAGDHDLLKDLDRVYAVLVDYSNILSQAAGVAV